MSEPLAEAKEAHDLALRDAAGWFADYKQSGRPDDLALAIYWFREASMHARRAGLPLIVEAASVSEIDKTTAGDEAVPGANVISIAELAAMSGIDEDTLLRRLAVILNRRDQETNADPVTEYRSDVVAWLRHKEAKWRQTASSGLGAARDAASFYAAAYSNAADGIERGEPERKKVSMSNSKVAATPGG